MTVRAEHKDESKEKNGGCYRYGSFCQSITLPAGVDETNINARYHSGVIELHLPKSEKARARRIPVNMN